MTKILDQYGKPIDNIVISEPQTARVAALQNQYLTPMLSGLTPARLAHALQEADQGSLRAQSLLFSDMEERDGHLRAEMDKRKNAVVGLTWNIVPPRDASAAETANAEWLREMLQDAVDPIEDLLLAMMEAVGHGYAPVELEWRYCGKELLPEFHPRPQAWFKLDTTRTKLRLDDATVQGAELRPFGWIGHTHGKAKSGYGGRMGLYRTLVWPFLYKSYALGDFAEFLETYGLPFIVGKYMSGASAAEKASLMRAVTALGHDARAIMPKEMEIEIETVSSSGGDSAHLAMMSWADKSQSKSILGQTLTADSGGKGNGSYALGKVHNEVRHDIRRGDARQVAATLTRDLVYPMIALNRGGVDGLARCPRFVFDLAEAEDLTAYSEALPKLVKVGFQIPLSWAQERLHIPLAKDGEPVLSISVAETPAAGGQALTALVPGTPAGALDGVPPAYVEQLAVTTAPLWQNIIDRIESLVNQATDLATLQRDMVDVFGGEAPESLVKLMATAFALAELKGMSDAQGGQLGG